MRSEQGLYDISNIVLYRMQWAIKPSVNYPPSPCSVRGQPCALPGSSSEGDAGHLTPFQIQTPRRMRFDATLAAVVSTVRGFRAGSDGFGTTPRLDP
jgi:hypothetical protein